MSENNNHIEEDVNYYSQDFSDEPTSKTLSKITSVFCRIYRSVTGRRCSRAQHDWCSYYSGLYNSKSPDLKTYKSLLDAHGVWNMPVPYAPGNPDYFTFHENGVFMADIDFIISDWCEFTLDKKNNINLLNLSSPLENIQSKISRIQLNWAILSQYAPKMAALSTVNALEFSGTIRRQENKKRMLGVAINCVTELFLSNKKNWLWLKESLHKENITILVSHMMANIDSDDIKKKLLLVWLENDFINNGFAKRLESSNIKSNVVIN